MKFSEMFEKVASYWPNQIVVDDCVGAGESRYSPKLWSLYEEIEEKYGIVESWEGVLNYSIYGELHKLLIKEFEKENYIILLDKVDKKKIEESMYNNFGALPEWDWLLAEYENDLEE
ncbi:hypothetical protein ACQ0P8_05680 [Halodesulfovibrio aestuarii]|uniref:Uncharacterized protein n=1 Tax=Halodesulfovibrio aestuarii TaxID=126333 RepID=A0A8G2FHE1_9BACT|nr:hypothetical protein [Halodesulfovibrio aestuarii]SHI84136.1 hypothetical protein SAMN05660830_01162 [Halodesulfovibrio aestuarii]